MENRFGSRAVEICRNSGASPTNNVADTTPVTPAATTPATTAASNSSAVVAPAPAVDATTALSTLLGSWYTGWMQYLQATFGLSDATVQQQAAAFAGLAPCAAGQADACKAAIWQQLSQMVGPAAGGS